MRRALKFFARIRWWMQRRRLDADAKRLIFRNGHPFRKHQGKTMWRGRLSFLPAPHPIETAQAGAELMLREGFIQFPDLISSEQIQALRKRMDEVAGPDEQFAPTKGFYQRHRLLDMQRDPIWLQLLDVSPAYEVIQMILGRGCVLTSAAQWVTGPGRQMEIHIDDLLPPEYYRDPSARFPICPVTLQYYLDDQVESIGPTTVIPGSHCAGRWPRSEMRWNGVPPQIVGVKAGGALLFRHDLWHGAAFNRGPAPRYMVQVHFAAAGRAAFCPAVSETMEYSPVVLDRISPRQQALMCAAAPTQSMYAA